MKQNRQSENHDNSTSEVKVTPSPTEQDKSARSDEAGAFVSLPVPGSGSLDRLVDTAKDYARHAIAENTNAAYKTDWAHFSSWCRRRGAEPLPPSPELLGLYIANCASPDNGAPALSVSTIERRLSGLAWHYQQRGFSLDRKDRHIATVLAGIKRKHARPPVQKEAILRDDILDMIDTLDFGLRDMRDRAILLIGYAGGLRRSEIVSLDFARDDTEDGKGWIAIEKQGLILTFRGKTGWREVEVGRGSSDTTCPVYALEQYLHYAKIDFGPLFQRVSRDDRKALGDRLSDKHVARLIKKAVLGEYPLCSNHPKVGGVCMLNRFEETLPNGASYIVLDLLMLPLDNTGEFTVPNGHIFLLGDHRDNSLDSRFSSSSGGFGFVPVDNIIGVLNDLP